MKYKQVYENFLLGILTGSTAKLIDKIRQYNREHGTEYKLKISDIISDVMGRKEFKKSQCANLKGELKFFCLKELNKRKISELERSKKLCKLNSDPQLCVLRIVEQINEIRIQNVKLQKDLNSAKMKTIKSSNIRHLKRDEYYGNEYKTTDEL